MSESKHTPGPWEYFDAKDSHGDVTIGVRGNTEYIATMDLVAIDSGPYRLPANADANARLIAAAPELLEVLNQSRIALRFYRERMLEDNPGINKHYPFGIDCENAVRAAIAKVEGR